MISIKNKDEIEIMRQAGHILAACMKEVAKQTKAGVSTSYLDKVARDFILQAGALPAFENYQGFPSTLCASVNNVVVHAVPTDYILKQGDIISLDLGLQYQGYYSDMAQTVAIGKISPQVKKMLKVAEKSLELGIKAARSGNSFGDIGKTIGDYVERQGFGVVRELCGHGIGKELHEAPEIPNYGEAQVGERIKEGMVFCLEPMITMGNWKLKKSKDGFGYETKDGSLACHTERTIAIVNNKPEVLTK